MVMWKIVRKAIDPFRNGVIVNRKGIVPENGGITGALALPVDDLGFGYYQSPKVCRIGPFRVVGS